jgi:hypothetical protein
MPKIVVCITDFLTFQILALIGADSFFLSNCKLVSKNQCFSLDAAAQHVETAPSDFRHGIEQTLARAAYLQTFVANSGGIKNSSVGIKRPRTKSSNDSLSLKLRKIHGNFLPL